MGNLFDRWSDNIAVKSNMAVIIVNAFTPCILKENNVTDLNVKDTYKIYTAVIECA